LDIFRCITWFCTVGLYKATGTGVGLLGLYCAAMHVFGFWRSNLLLVSQSVSQSWMCPFCWIRFTRLGGLVRSHRRTWNMALCWWIACQVILWFEIWQAKCGLTHCFLLMGYKQSTTTHSCSSSAGFGSCMTPTNNDHIKLVCWFRL
jgi:hypothetical protein